MKKRKAVGLKSVSVLLTLCILSAVIFCAPITVSATDTATQHLGVVTPEANTAGSVTIDNENYLAGYLGETGYNGEGTERVPVRRLYEEEGDDLNTTVWLNSDGTRTMTIYDYPVKYVDKNGDIQDILLEVAEATDGSGAYKTKAGWVDTVFPSKITDGITMSADGNCLRLTPVMEQNSKSISNTDKIVADRKVSKKNNKVLSYGYDSKTNLEYSLTHNGFKEDIVVNEYTGQTEYTFKLETGGLTLVNEDGSYFLKNSKGETKAALGDILIFTADELNNTMGYMTHEAVKENQLYLITIHVDAEWLKDENTAYPIRIDPSLEMTSSNLIEDVTIFSGYNATNATSGELFVGRRDDLGTCRVLIKFPGLDLSKIDSANNVISAGIRFYDLYRDENPMGVYAYIYDGLDWEDDTASWAHNANGYTHFMSHNDVSYDNGSDQSHTYYFSITPAVKYWLLTDEERAARTDNYEFEKGIMLKAKDDLTMSYQYKAFGSYNNSTHRPSIEIIYNNEEYIVSKPFGWFDKVTDTEIGGWAWCFDMPDQPLEFSAILYNESTETYELNTGNYTIVNRPDVEIAGYGTGNYGFTIPVDWKSLPAGLYRIKAYVHNIDGEVYEMVQSPRYYNNVGVLLNKSSLTMIEDQTFHLEREVILDDLEVSELTWTSSDTRVATVSQNGLVTAISDGTTTITASFIAYDTETQYSVTCEVTVEKTKCSESDISVNENKAYWIKAVNSNKYLTVMNREWKSGSNVGLTYYDGNETSSDVETIQHPNMYWKIECIVNGEFIISPYNSLGMILSVDGASNNVQLSEKPLSLYDVDANSLWRVKLNDDGTVSFLSKGSDYNKSLEISGNNAFVKTVANDTRWEIIRINCGGFDGGGVNAYGHALVPFEASEMVYDKYVTYTRYKCVECPQVFKSPEEQDIEVLEPKHYITVLHLQRAYAQNVIQGDLQKADATMRAINYIRGLDLAQRYGKKYDFTNRNGDFISCYKYLYDKYDCSVYVSQNDITQAETTYKYISELALIPGPIQAYCSAVKSFLDIIDNIDTISATITRGVRELTVQEKFEALVKHHAWDLLSPFLPDYIESTINGLNDAWELCNLYDEYASLGANYQCIAVRYCTKQDSKKFYCNYNYDSIDSVKVLDDNGGMCYGESYPGVDGEIGKLSYSSEDHYSYTTWVDMTIDY